MEISEDTELKWSKRDCELLAIERDAIRYKAIRFATLVSEYLNQKFSENGRHNGIECVISNLGNSLLTSADSTFDNFRAEARRLEMMAADADV